MIPKELLIKYSMATLDEEKSIWGDNNNTVVAWYETFLKQTDYICNKIVEGVAEWSDYAEEKKYRQIAREEINKLR